MMPLMYTLGGEMTGLVGLLSSNIRHPPLYVAQVRAFCPLLAWSL